jgi:hypothetical protein
MIRERLPPPPRLRRDSRLLAFFAAACVAGYVHAYTGAIAGTPIRSDAYSYFVYLPSWLIYHDATLQAVADDCCGGEYPAFTAITRWPSTGRWVNAHPIGVAVLVVPFFVAAHALTLWSNLTPDGFTPYYQHAAGLAGLCYIIAGLWLVRRFLRRHFTDGVADATLAALLFGTSLFHYATFDSMWSHAFSFALCAALLERCDAWARPGPSNGARARAAVVIGLLAGAMVLVRHTNVIVPIAIVGTLFAVEPSFRRFAPVTIAAAAVAVFPQLWVYHSATGHWIVSAYATPGFSWGHPMIAAVLMGTKKGLFFWAPLLLLAVAGLARLPPSLRRWLAAILAVFAVDTYVMASWFDWQLGASYGHRGYVDIYPLLAPGLAAMFTTLSARPALKLATTATVVLLCALSMFQMLQYWHGVMPMSDTTWRQYKAVFLKPW